MFATFTQIHLYLSKYRFQNHENNNADAMTSYLKHDIISSSRAFFWHVFHMVQIGHSLERFCCHQFLNTNNSTLVVSIAPFCFDHCCKPSRHVFNQFLTLLFWNLLPQLLYSVPKFTNTTCSRAHCESGFGWKSAGFQMKHPYWPKLGWSVGWYKSTKIVGWWTTNGYHAIADWN